MNYVILLVLIVAGCGFTGCSEKATRTEFRKRDVSCLRCYCASNALTAETALLELARYAGRCQNEKVSGIPYDDIFARTYARLYLVEKHLGKSQAAQQHLRDALEYYKRSGRKPGSLDLAPAMVGELLAQKADLSLAVAWSRQ